MKYKLVVLAVFLVSLCGCQWRDSSPKNEVIVYSSPKCPSCFHAKNHLKNNHIKFTEKNIKDNQQNLEEFKSLPNKPRTVPQIVVNQQAIGGWDDLKALSKEDFNKLFKQNERTS